MGGRKCKPQVDTTPKKHLLWVRKHGGYFKFFHLSKSKTEAEDEENDSGHLGVTPVTLKLPEERDFVFHSSSPNTHACPWHIVRDQKITVDKEQMPGSELTKNVQGERRLSTAYSCCEQDNLISGIRKKSQSPKKI